MAGTAFRSMMGAAGFSAAPGDPPVAGDSFTSGWDTDPIGVFWAGGSRFQGLGYSNGANLTSWPNEIHAGTPSSVQSSDLTLVLNTLTVNAAPSYVAAGVNGQPSVQFAAKEWIGAAVADFAQVSPPTVSWSLLTVFHLSANTGGTHYIVAPRSDNSNISRLAANGTLNYQLNAGVNETVGTPNTTAPHVLRGEVKNTNTSIIDLDNGAFSSVGSAGAFGMSSISLGMPGGDVVTDAMEGNIALVIAYRGEISADSNFAAVMADIATLYGTH